MPLLANDTSHHIVTLTTPRVARPAQVTFSTEWDSAAESLATLNDALRVFINSHIAPQLDDSYILDRIDSVGRNATGTDFAAGAVINNVGDRVGEVVPLNYSVLVRKSTGLRGRRNRGRMFWPGMAQEAEVDQAGVLTVARVASLQAAFTAFFAALAGRVPNSNMLLLHTSAPTTPVPITDLVVQALGATQRRRMRG